MPPTATLVSFRLGGTDGVSIEAAKWCWALETLGFDVRRVAGRIDGPSRTGDLVLPWLAIDPPAGTLARPEELLVALRDSALVDFENVCSLPLNAKASAAAASVAAQLEGRIVFHDHDLPSQRDDLASVRDLPPAVPGALHVTVNELSRRELTSRGLDARTIRNCFDIDAPPGDRFRTRAQLGFEDHELVVLQPSRGIARKNVPAGISFAEALHERMRAKPVRYWLTGPAEDGYGPNLDKLVADASIPVTIGLAATPADAHAASDVVVFPSTWEGFGNPVVESVVARRPLVTGHYPALDELLALGFRFFAVEEPDAVARWLLDPDPSQLETNLEIARRECALAQLPRSLRRAFVEMGWTEW